MQARLRAQLGDRSKYSGERRRRSVVVASIVLTITDPLRGSTHAMSLSPSCAHSLLRSFIRLHGVNHNQPFPTATSLHKILTSFAIFMVFQCFRSITSLPGLVFRRRRAVFILLAMPPTSLARAALVMWCGRFKPLLEIRHSTALTTGAKHWHRQKAVFYVFVSVPQFLSTEPRVGRGIDLFFTIITDPLRGSTPHHFLITKLRSIALQFSLAWCFA